MMLMIVSLLILCCLFFLMLLHYFPSPPKKEEKCYDMALVLGCPCQDDGTLSWMQKRRIDHAIKLYKQGAYHLLIISGGTVKNNFNEAKAMQAYARSHILVPCEIETKAANTYENFLLSRSLWKKHHCHSAIIITSPFHARRANYFAKRYFHDYCISCYSQHDRWRHWPQEWFCMVKCLWIEHQIKKNRS